MFNNIFIAKIVSIFILIICASGFYPRFTCIPHWWVTYSFCNSSLIIDGGDQVGNIMTFLLIPVFLMDKRKNHFIFKPYEFNFYKNTILYFSILLIKIQTIVIYFHSAVGKFKVTEWYDGTALYYWFNNVIFGMPKYLNNFVNVIFKNPVLLTLLTWSVLFIELFIVFSIIHKSNILKKSALFLGLIFHFFIIIFHGLTSFFFPMASILLLSLSKINSIKNKNE